MSFLQAFVAKFLATRNQTILKSTDKPTCPETRESGPNDPHVFHMH
jgi:hypothetical protein